MWYEYKNGEKVTRFSIRKYHFGAASVAVASLIFFGGGMSAKAENVPATKDVQVEKTTESTSNDGEKSADNSETDKKKISVDVPASALPTAKVDKAELNKLTIGLDKDIRATDAEKISSISKDLDKVLADAKELLEKDSVTATEVEKQVEELKKAKTKLDETVKAFDEKASKEASEKAESATEENKEAEIPKKRGRKSNRTEAPAESADSSSTSADSSSASENNAKQLPTYTNGSKNAGTYALKDEMDKIVAYLRKNGGDETKVALIKANSDKLNEKLGLVDEDGKLSEEDFNKALQDLDYARATIEGFLADKENGGKTELPKPEAVLNREQEEEASEEQPTTIQPRSTDNSGARTRSARAAGQDRASVGANWPDYDTAKTWFIEDGSKHSPYRKYTSLWFSDQRKDTNDTRSYNVKGNTDSYIVEKVTKIKGGYYWELEFNRGEANGNKHSFLDNTYWFTTPKGHTIRPDSISISKNNVQAENAPDNQITTALNKIGMKDVAKGTVDRTGQSPFALNVFRKYNLDDLVRQDGFYRREAPAAANQPGQDTPMPKDVQAIVDKKYNALKADTQDLYTFTIANNTSYKLTFVTNSDQPLNSLVFGSGVIAERSSSGAKHRLNAHEIYAKTTDESSLGDRYPIRTKGNNFWKVNQDEYSIVNFGNDGTALVPNVYQQSAAVNHPENARGVLISNGQEVAGGSRNVDTTSYFEPDSDLNIEQYKQQINTLNGRDVDYLWEQNGVRIPKGQEAKNIAQTPGVKRYLVTRSFTDGTHDKIDLNFVVKPKKPTLSSLANKAETTSDVTASGGTNGYDMVLYRKLDNGKLEQVKMTKNGVETDAVAKANASGVATFTGVELVPNAKYVVKTVVEGTWIDYDGNKKSTVESDNSDEMTATIGQRFATQPEITQDATNLSLSVKIGQSNATKAVVRYTDANNKEQNVTFVKDNAGNWSNTTTSANTAITVEKNDDGTAIVRLPDGVAKPDTTLYAKQRSNNMAYSAEASKKISNLQVGTTRDGNNFSNFSEVKYPIPWNVAGNNIKFLAKSSKGIKKFDVTGGEGSGLTGSSDVPTGSNPQYKTTAVNTVSGNLVSKQQAGIYNLTATATTVDNETHTHNISLIVPPTVNKSGEEVTFKTTSAELQGKGSQKPTISTNKIFDSSSTTEFQKTGTPADVEWKAFLVKGGRTDLYNDVAPKAVDYTVVASTKIKADGTATFTESDYKLDQVGTANLRLVVALVQKGTDNVYKEMLSELSNSTIKATDISKFPTTPPLDVTSTGDVVATIGENGATQSFMYYNLKNGTRRQLLLQKSNGKWALSILTPAPEVTLVNEANGIVKVTVPYGVAPAGSTVSAEQAVPPQSASERNSVTVPTDNKVPVVKVGNTTLPETRADADNNDAVYTVSQGEDFRPVIKAWDNYGKLTKFEVTGGSLPNGVAVNTTNLSQTTKYLNESSAYSPSFTGSVPENLTPGVYTREIKVSDGNTAEKTYYFKYRVLPKAPTVDPSRHGETVLNDEVLSTDTSLSGTATPNARVKVTVAGKVLADNVQVGSDGRWTLRLTKGLNSNITNQSQLVPKDIVAVTQIVNNTESKPKNVNVSVGAASIEASDASQDGASLVAG